jgi:hypothetical protein
MARAASPINITIDPGMAQVKLPDSYQFAWQKNLSAYTQYTGDWNGPFFPVKCSHASIMRGLLVEAANHIAIRNMEDAMGKCFLSSVEFAIAFSKYAELRLIRWEVKDDVHYCEHWAVGISDSEVIDLTRVQVDGNTEVLHQISSYPANYTQMKQYPVSVVLQPGRASKDQPDTMRPKWAPIKMRWTMLRYDLASTPLRLKRQVLGKGIIELTRFTCWLLANALLHRLEMRQKMLDNRLRRTE